VPERDYRIIGLTDEEETRPQTQTVGEVAGRRHSSSSLMGAHYVQAAKKGTIGFRRRG